MRRVPRACRRRCRGGVPREAAFEGFAHRFGQERPGDGVGRRESLRVKCADAWRPPVVGGEDAELFVGEASRRGGVRSGGVGVCCEESTSGVSEGFGAGRFSQGRGRGGCRHCLSFHSTSLRFLYKCEVLWRSDTPRVRGWRRFPERNRPFERSVAMRAVATKSLVIWPHVCWPEGCFFGHWRSGTTFSLVTWGATRRAVRKHRAPKGALRHKTGADGRSFVNTGLSQKAPSAKRRIKTIMGVNFTGNLINSQKAPSTKRCIKTPTVFSCLHRPTWVRKHRAPKGALRRHGDVTVRRKAQVVRKHRAPKGALRALQSWVWVEASRPHAMRSIRSW